MLVVFRLQVPNNDVSGAAASRGAEGHDVRPAPGDGYLGDEVLTTPQDGAQILEGGGAEELDVDDVTLAFIRVSEDKEAVIECRLSNHN